MAQFVLLCVCDLHLCAWREEISEANSNDHNAMVSSAPWTVMIPERSLYPVRRVVPLNQINRPYSLSVPLSVFVSALFGDDAACSNVRTDDIRAPNNGFSASHGQQMWTLTTNVKDRRAVRDAASGCCSCSLSVGWRVSMKDLCAGFMGSCHRMPVWEYKKLGVGCVRRVSGG